MLSLLVFGSQSSVSFNQVVTIKADLDGDHKLDEAKMTIENDKVEIKIQGSQKTQTLSFNVLPNNQGGLCKGDKDLLVEKPGLALEEAQAMDDEEAKLVNQIDDLANAGMKGLKLVNGGCDSFHIYYHPIAKEFTWWRL